MFKKLTMTAAAAAMFVAGMVGQAAAGEVTLRLTGIVVDGPSDTTIANFEAFVIYDTSDRSCLDQSFPCVGPGAPINILYENVTITLTVVEIPSGIVTTITKTMSQIELIDLFDVPPGDSLEINDGGNRTDPSGWSGTLFGGEITRVSWNFQDHSQTAFAGYDPDLPFAPTRNLFPDLFNGVLVLSGGASPSFGFEEIVVEVTSFLPDVLAVDIDIKPGSFPNSINQGSGGVIPVAILGSETFDATLVDGGTCTLGDAMVKIVGRSDKLLCSVEDVNDDGFLDQVCKFVTIDLGAAVGDTEASIHCSAPEEIEGTDSIRLVPPE